MMTESWQPQIKSEAKPLYVSLVEALADDIAAGTLAPGAKLPTHRDLADRLGLAIGTITRAYAEAERRGLIHGEGRRGTIVGTPKSAPTAGANPFQQNSGLIDLATYLPAASEDPDLIFALRQLSRRPQTRWLLQYTPTEGLEHHREAGARWMGILGLTVDPGSLVITNGAQHAITVIMAALARKGDVFAAEAYTYVGVKAVTRLLGLDLVGIPMDNEGILPDALDAVCRKKKIRALYINPTLHNPTNTIVPESRRRAIVKVAERHGFDIIEDAINRVLVPNPPPLLASLAPDRTYLVGSVSKAVAAGLRICFVKGPSGTERRLAEVVRTTSLMVSPLPLEIFTQWINDGTVEETIKRRRLEGIARQRLAVDIFRGHPLGANETSYFIWLPLGDTWTSKEFTLEARLKGISVAPATLFAVDEASSENGVRVCLGGIVARDDLSRALKTLADILNNPVPRGITTI